MDHDGRDLIGDDPYDDGEYDGGPPDDARREGSAGRALVTAATVPAAVAVASLVLAVLSLLGLGLLNGSVYMPPPFSAEPAERSVLVVTVLIGAGLALLPVALAVWALRGLPVDSPWRAVAGAGALLGALAVLLRLLVALRTATDDTVQFVPF